MGWGLMKKLGLLIGLLVVCVLTLNLQYKKIIQNPIKTDKDVHVNVKTGDTLYSILDDLNQNGVIKNSSIIKFYIKNKELKSSVHPGRFLVPKDASIAEFVNILSTVGVDEDIVKVTVPEGFDIDRVATLLQEKGIISKEKFIESCKTYKLPTSCPPATWLYVPALAGSAFPTTPANSRPGAPGSPPGALTRACTCGERVSPGTERNEADHPEHA